MAYSKPKNIILRMPNWIGDLVMATPILADLRKAYPQAKITAMCQANIAPVLEQNPHIDAIYSYRKPKGWLGNAEHLAIFKTLRQRHYDLGILLTNSFSSAFWFWAGRVQNRIGLTGNLRHLFLNKAVAIPKQIETQHLVLTYKQILAPLEIPPSETNPQLYLSQQEEVEALQLLESFGIQRQHTLIGINPGAAYGSAKCWLPERFQAVTKLLLEKPDVHVIYFGDQQGSKLVHDICAPFTERVINLAGKTSLRSLMALIKSCSVFLTNDSGPMHIAAALKTPLIALFGSTNDTKTGPYNHGIIIHKHVECSPCYKRICPIDFRCMKRITAEEVYQAILSVENQSSG